MRILEYKLIGNEEQFTAIDEAIRTTQFVRNKCLRLWMDDPSVKPYDLNRYCAVLANEVPFVQKLNSQARQAAAERAAYAIARYLKPDVNGDTSEPPSFQSDCRSVEYKQTGWKLSEDRKRITFTDGIGIGAVKLFGSHTLCSYDLSLIKRVRILRRADGYYVQFCIAALRVEEQTPSGRATGIDVGLKKFFTDSDGNSIDCPKFLRKAEKQIKRLQRRVSRKKKKSANRKKARQKLARKHLQVQRQRKDFAVKAARCVVMSNDVVAVEDLQIANMVKNHHLAKSISDASWGIFFRWLLYYGSVYGRIVVAVPPQFTSQDCSQCGKRVKKSLSERTHICSCGCVLDRDLNAALNILRLGLAIVSRLYPGAQGNSGSSDPKTLGKSEPLPTS